jgi:hypothetical protein
MLQGKHICRFTGRFKPLGVFSCLKKKYVDTANANLETARIIRKMEEVALGVELIIWEL